MNGAERKRKAIDDFFLPKSKRYEPQKDDDTAQECHELTCPKSAFFNLSGTAVPGLSLYLDFVNSGEEESILAFLNDSNANVYEDCQRPQYCIVNEYTGNLGISAHTENFQFAEPVVGLSLSSSCPIRFHELAEPFDGSVRSGKAAKACKTGRVVDVEMPPRSLLVMNGPSRWSWQHEILRTAKGRGPGWKRVSLTFRYKPGT
ncbi:MAG: hypothetical protein Q9218_003954 [Villophora microphyllina]